MEIIKYDHIQNVHPELSTIKEFFKYHPEGKEAEWVATEKVHGANFQFCVTADGNISCCSRNFVLDGTYEFYNYNQLLEKYRTSVLKVFKYVCQKEGTESLIIRLYGELFGGEYPGFNWDGSPKGDISRGKPKNLNGGEPMAAGDGGLGAEGTVAGPSCNDVIQGVGDTMKVKPIGEAVQKEVLYLPDIEFYLFEISYARLDVDEEHPDRQPSYLDIDEIVAAGSDAGFTYIARPMYRGTLHELIELSPEYITTIPALAGLPPIEDNLSEGYVLRPARSINRKSMFRLKLKSVSFYEFTYGGGAEKPQKEPKARKKKPKKPTGKVVVLTELENEMKKHILSGLNFNRLASVASKLDRATFKGMDDRRLASLMVNDVLEDLVNDRPDLGDLFTDLDNATLKNVKGAVFGEAADIVEEERPKL